MIKEIKYNGCTANPSDYECTDGDLATAIGFVPEDGTMKPALPPSLVLQLESGAAVKFIHETANFRHYIILKTNGSLQWWDGEEESTPTSLRTFTTTLHQVTAVGNTLIVLASDGMHYFLWKVENEGYLYLGTEIPECPLSFGLQGEMLRTDEFTISFANINFFSGDVWKEFTDENKSTITSQVLAKVNKFIADNSTNAGKFMFPFFVRYAYRLYDGTLTMHSAPILMVCSSDLAPQCFVTNLHGKDTSTSINSAKLRLASMFHQLDYAVDSSSALDKLKNWDDIVKSVDIFVSKPIYTYDQNGQCTKFVNTDYSDCYSICKNVGQKASVDTYPLQYQKNRFSQLYAMTFSPTSLEVPTWRLMLPQRDGDAIKQDITDNCLFYLLKSINVEDLKTERTIIPINKEYLQSLVTREVMTDDYDSHDKIIPQYSFTYNSRINICNIEKQLFEGYDCDSLLPYTDGFVGLYTDDATPTQVNYTVGVEVYYYIKQDGRDIVARSNSGSLGMKAPVLWLYHPNVNAYKAVLVITQYVSSKMYEVHLEPHPLLNGAYYFGGWDGINSDGAQTISYYPEATSDKSILLLNKIYTSEVNNPFYFPVLGINTVGTGNILGICAAAKALSEGQFGQFPLYAFTTEGVWALEVSNTGTYSAKQPITRDVVINPDSITQIDSAVLFATDRGIMHISGSTVQCISDSLNTADLFTIADLPRADKLVGIFNSKADESEQITLDNITLLPFNEFLRGCRMVYDYTNQRIIVYNASVRYAYVFSLKSKSWGMMRSDIVDNVNSYPEALAMADGAKLVDFSKPVAENITALIITRPFKMDDPNSFKTINTIIQRGMFRSTHVQQVLYGSNDLIHWHTVWSSVDKIMRGFRGTPYKAYRLALVCRFDKAESLYGCTVVYEPRMTNQVR